VKTPCWMALYMGMSLVGIGCTPRGAAVAPGRSQSHYRAARPAEPIPEDRQAAGQTLYVPTYSWVATADAAEPFPLAVTLVIRNTDPSNTIVISRVAYYHQDGELVKEELAHPLAIRPLGSIDFFVKESDTSAGMASSFAVDWGSEQVVSPPLVESLMVSTAGMQGVSFRCQAQGVRDRHPRPDARPAQAAH